MKYLLLCVMSKTMLLYLLVGASPAMAEPVKCASQDGTLIGVSRPVMLQAARLIRDNDREALLELVKRGQILLVSIGEGFRAESLETHDGIIAVRKVGSPDTVYAFRSQLNCAKPGQ